MKTFTFFIYSIILLVTLNSCKTIEVSPPDRIPYDKPIRTNKPSTIKISASVSQDDIIQAVRKEIKNPIVDGKPLEVFGTIKAIQTITEKELIRKIVKPYTPGHWINISKKTFRTVRKSFSCALKPWKWGTCWKNVLEEVWVVTKVWIEPQAEIFKWVAIEVIKLVDKVYKTEMRIHYPTDLVDVKIKFVEDNFILETDFRTNLKFDYEQAVIPLGPTLSLNSVMKAPVYSKVRVKGRIIILSPGALKIEIDKAATEFTFGSFSPNLPIIEGEDIDKLLFPVIANFVKPQTEKIAEKAITDALIKAIDDNLDALNFRGEINDFTKSIAEPKLLSDNLWLNVKPMNVLSGQIRGKDNRLYYTAGLEFFPSIEYTPVPPSVLPDEIPFIVREKIDNKSNIDLQLKVGLKLISDEIKTHLNQYILEEESIKKLVHVNEVELYKTNDEKLAIKIVIHRKRLFKKFTFFANAYVTTNIMFNNLRGHFTFENIGFTLETRNALVNSILNPIIDDSVVELLNDNSTYSIRDEIRIANSVIRDTTINLPYGNIRLKFSPINISNPYITDENLEVNSMFKGEINFEYIPNDQKALYSNSLTNQHLSLAYNSDSENERIEFERSSNVILRDERILTTNIDSIYYIDYDRMDLHDNNFQSNISQFVFNLNIGDTIFIEEKGIIKRRILKFEDLPNNDEILISRNPGKIERLRLNKNEYINYLMQNKLNTAIIEIDTIKINDIFNYIDQNVVIEGKLQCFKTFTAPSGEDIKILKLDDCENDDVNIFLYLGSVTDGIPGKSYLGKRLFINAFVTYENGKPTIKIKRNGRIKLK